MIVPVPLGKLALQGGVAGRQLPIADAYQDVDDRLRLEAGDGGAADVVDAALDPGADRFFHGRPLPLEAGGPFRIWRDEADEFIRAHRVSRL
jgi:hypothetical protein